MENSLVLRRSSKGALFKVGLLLLLMVLLSLCMGAYALSPIEIIQVLGAKLHLIGNEVDEQSAFLIVNIRLPRICLALLVGAALGISGAAIQVVFRNPLAEPGLIGISSGAMLFAACFIVLKEALPVELGSWSQSIGLSISAFLGALLATMAVYRLSTQGGKTQVATMLLAGIAMTAIGGSLTGLLIFYATDTQLRDITFWNLGSVSAANWNLVLLLGSVFVLACFFIIKQAKSLEIMQLGSQEANYLGVDVERTKRSIVLWVVLMVGTCVAFTGMIGFIGLIVPHLVRIYFKHIPFSTSIYYTGMLGAGLLLGADTLSRTIVAPAELPIGILTAIIGAPFFLWLLSQQKDSLL